MSAAFLYTHAAAMLVAAALAGAGTYKVMDNAQRAEAAARLEDERLASELRETDARQQRRFGDIGAGQHATALASINNKLGDARAHIARLSDRQCLGADTTLQTTLQPAAPATLQ